MLGLLLLAGCGSLAREDASPGREQSRPQWDAGDVRNHLRVFNEGIRRGGRQQDTTSTARVEAYVAARLAEFRLQPALEQSYRIPFSWPRHLIRHAALQRAGADTASVVELGQQMVPDGRSDAGRATVTAAMALGPSSPARVRDGGEETRAVPHAVFLGKDAATTSRLVEMAEAGVEVVFVVGPLTGERAARPIRSLLVLQVTPVAAAQLVRRPPEEVRAVLNGAADAEAPWRTYANLIVRVDAQTLPEAPATNVLGFMPGKHPEKRRQLVIVCADLKEVPRVLGMEVVHPHRLGGGAAALLEATRHLAHYARHWPVPERTVLVAFWSGETTGTAGLRAYLANPLWSLERTTSVIYVGAREQTADEVRSLLAPYAIPVHTVSVATDSLGPDAALLLREGSVVGRNTPALSTSPSKLWEQAVPATLDAARDVYGLMLREAVTPSLIVPVRPDSLAVPLSER